MLWHHSGSLRALGSSLIVLGLVAGASVARADDLRSYAYVTATSRYTSDTNGVNSKDDTCTITARLPHDVVAHRPAGAAPELLRGATEISQRVDDLEDGCAALAHTWQRVTFDSKHPDKAQLVLPKTHWSTVTWLLMLGLELVMLVAIKDRFGKLRAARRGRS